MKFKKIIGGALLALGLLASQQAPASALLFTTTSYKWIPGGAFGSASSQYALRCTSGPFVKSQSDGFYWKVLPSHCDFSGPSNPTINSNYAKFAADDLSIGSANYYTNGGGNVRRPISAIGYTYDVILVGPFAGNQVNNVSGRVADYCARPDGIIHTVCAGNESAGAGTYHNNLIVTATPQVMRRPATGLDIIPGIQTPDDVVGLVNVCVSGFKGGTDCGTIYGTDTVTGPSTYSTPVYKLDLGIGPQWCGFSGGDSGSPVWIQDGAEAIMVGMLLGGTDSVLNSDPKCYTTPTYVSYDIALIGIDAIRDAFPSMDLRFVDYSVDGLN